MPYLRDSKDDFDAADMPEAHGLFSAPESDSINQDESHSLKLATSREKKIECTLSSRGVVQAKPLSNQTNDGPSSEVESYLTVSSLSPSARSSPKSTRVDTCPVHLSPLVPPVNYGIVERGMIYRSGFPHEQHMNFIESLGIRSILTLVDTTPSEEYRRHVCEFGIDRTVVNVAPNKEGKISTAMESLCEALLFALDPSHYPLYIHCNHGRHRTGCIVGCLRKFQGWPLDEILAEYNAYASPKGRSGDIDLITSFDPELVYRYADSRGPLRHCKNSALLPLSPYTNVGSLAIDLPRHNIAQLDDSAGEDGQYSSHPSSRRARINQQTNVHSFLFPVIGKDDRHAARCQN